MSPILIADQRLSMRFLEIFFSGVTVVVSRVFRNYTKLAMLAFLYWFLVKSKINLSKKFTCKGIEPESLGLWHLLHLHFHAFPTELT